MSTDESADVKHLLDLFELLYHWHDGPAGQRHIEHDIVERYTEWCSDSLISAYGQLRAEYMRDHNVSRPGSFAGYARTLALSCVIELDPGNLDQVEIIGEMVGPSFAQAPIDAIGRRWLEDAVSTAWRIAVPDSAGQQRGR